MQEEEREEEGLVGNYEGGAVACIRGERWHTREGLVGN